MRITVDHPSSDELTQESWAFYISDSWHDYDGIAVVLDTYTVSKRSNFREKLRAESEWSRWGTCGFGGVLRLDKPPKIPEWVRTSVVKKINESITFLPQTETPSAGVGVLPEKSES